MKPIDRIKTLLHKKPGFEFKVLTFKAQGMKIRRKGYAFYWNNEHGIKIEMITIEPVHYTDYKWFVLGDFFKTYQRLNISHEKDIWNVVNKIVLKHLEDSKYEKSTKF